jgi:hypothetical protein
MPDNVTRFPNGVVDASESSPFANYAGMVPNRYHVWFDDFDGYIAAEWVVTETQAGATQAAASADGGVLVLTNSAADNDLNSLQWAGSGGATVVESFKYQSTKDMVIAARFKLDEVLQSDLLVGLAITDTSPLATLPSDGLFFYKNDGAAALTAELRKDSTSTSLAVGNMVADTYVEVAMVYNAAALQWKVFLNGSPVASTTTLTNVVDDEELTLTISLQNGEAVAKVLSIDYLFVAKAR